jgi:hypothetical protein
VKIGGGSAFVAELHRAIDERYRPGGRIAVYAFDTSTPERVRAARLRVAKVPATWYRRLVV